ncbi:MAG TPA: threonine synthase [Caulobacteraceae bacterium]|nr:threonine synthase [Caulobacteraceae bacterium]
MRYVSTRGEAPAIGFLDAVLAGLAPDGGLYVPEEWPSFTPAEIAAFDGKPYAQVAAAVIGKFAGADIAADDLREMTEDAYASFTHPCVTPVKQLYPGISLLELFHGPTLAFKDVAMQILARLYDKALKAQGRTLTIVAATSGDTGGAAVEAFRGASNARMLVLFPEGRISEVQRRFMTTAAERNVRTVSIDGSFDDCQSIVKALFQDRVLRQAVDLSGVNSINWARIAAQAVYYFTSGAALGAPGRKVSFVVPTGNFGDAFAGFVAHKMGLPIERIVAATNSNDIVSRALETGRYERGAVLATQSPAMDIQIASNFERLYFEATRREALETARTFDAFARTGSVTIPPQAFAAMRELFSGEAVDEGETSRTIVATLNETGELIDPHTAVAVAAAKRLKARGKLGQAPLIVLSTAHPAKFPEAVEASGGGVPPLPAAAVGIGQKPERFDHLPNDIGAVKAYLTDFAGAA